MKAYFLILAFVSMTLAGPIHEDVEKVVKKREIAMPFPTPNGPVECLEKVVKKRETSMSFPAPHGPLEKVLKKRETSMSFPAPHGPLEKALKKREISMPFPTPNGPVNCLEKVLKKREAGQLYDDSHVKAVEKRDASITDQAYQPLVVKKVVEKRDTTVPTVEEAVEKRGTYEKVVEKRDAIFSEYTLPYYRYLYGRYGYPEAYYQPGAEFIYPYQRYLLY